MKKVFLSISGFKLLESKVFRENRCYKYDSLNQNNSAETRELSTRYSQTFRKCRS